MGDTFHSIGIMTGTSADAVDVGYIISDGDTQVTVKEGEAFTFPKELRKNILKLAAGNTENLASIENEYTSFVAQCVNNFLENHHIDSSKIDFLGFHGQTIFHDPANHITTQIGDANLLAKTTAINVYSDFRSADVAAGGQGAPLVPIFHKAICKEKPCAILNIGGVSNISYVDDEQIIGFDTGPGNALIDDFCTKNFNVAFDKGGEMASQGKVISSILNKWLEHPYLQKTLPKSLDRNAFVPFLSDVMGIDKFDALATLTEFTVQTIGDSIKNLSNTITCIYITGGGGKNTFMMNRLHEATGLEIKHVEDLGISSEFMEAYAFGYLAIRSHLGLPITFPSTTGCPKAISGGVFTKVK